MRSATGSKKPGAGNHPAMPERIRLRRTKGWRLPAGAVVVARPSKWGNPWRIDASGSTPYSVADRATAVARFREFISAPYDSDEYPPREQIQDELGGHDLACWCPLDGPCHADVLLEIAKG
jgi:hypothetical protein